MLEYSTARVFQLDEISAGLMVIDMLLQADREGKTTSEQ